jgi:hypothetical protein
VGRRSIVQVWVANEYDLPRPPLATSSAEESGAAVHRAVHKA